MKQLDLQSTILVNATANCDIDLDSPTIFDWPAEVRGDDGNLLPNIISVTNVGMADQTFSGFGVPICTSFGANTVSIGAPGENVTMLGVGNTSVPSCSGSSLAAPLVTGTVGLVLSVDPSLRGDLTRLRNRILCNAQVATPLDGRVMGGRALDVNAAVRNLNSCP